VEQIVKYVIDNIKPIIPNAIAGLVAGLSAVGILKLIEYWTQPKLKVYFDPNRTFEIRSVGPRKKFRYIHLIVENTSSRIAKECQVFLLKLEMKKRNRFKDLKLPVHLILMWSNEPLPKGFFPLEIPGDRDRRVDLFHSPTKGLHLDKFFLMIEGGPRGISNIFDKGTYRFTLQFQGTNTNKVIKRFLVVFKGTSKIMVKEEKSL